MISYNIDTVENAEKLVNICRKYEDSDIDVIYGRQIIDGKSILGVMSLMGKMVTVKINNEENEKEFEQEINNAV